MNEEELKKRFQEDLTMLMIKLKLTKDEDERSLIKNDIENLKKTYCKELTKLSTNDYDSGKRHR